MRRKTTRLLLMGMLGALLLGWLVLRLEESLLYYPTPMSATPGGATPASLGIPFENVTLQTADGETLQAWWLPRPEPGAPTLLFFHGNAGNREDRLHNLGGLWRAGFSVLIFDYRGYGGSTGRPSEDGLTEDGLAALAWLRQKLPGQPIVFFGRSLGGAVAAAVALRHPPQALILESTFTSAADMAPRVLPLPGVRLLVRSRFDVLAALGELRMPLLVIHGTTDTLVPYEMGRRLFESAATKTKQFRAVPGGGHNDTYLLPGPAYYDWLREFVANS